jgi:hypothetical protein
MFERSDERELFESLTKYHILLLFKHRKVTIWSLLNILITILLEIELKIIVMRDHRQAPI